jgi:hypothetical protein
MAAGHRSLLASWVGGAVVPKPKAGVRSLLAFWMGGAVAGTAVIPSVVHPGGGRHFIEERLLQRRQERIHRDEEDRLLQRRRRERIRRDDGDLLELLIMFTGNFDC